MVQIEVFKRGEKWGIMGDNENMWGAMGKIQNMSNITRSNM